MRDVCRDLGALFVNNQTNAVTNGTLKMPKDYKLAQVQHGRELQDMCVRITQELEKEFDRDWNCIASEKLITSWVRAVRGSYLNIQLPDLFFEIFRSP
uniref:Uncharacterized protein n=1 Tax=Panagrolaimus davidi TaxID=227884 RepID=A0A914PWA5_9BILA